MIKLRVFTVSAVMLALALAYAGCSPIEEQPRAILGEECRTDADCVGQLHCCDDRCHECCEEYDCDPGDECVDYECVPIEEPPPLPKPECTANQDCENLHGEGWECTDGTCVEADKEEPAAPEAGVACADEICEPGLLCVVDECVQCVTAEDCERFAKDVDFWECIDHICYSPELGLDCGDDVCEPDEQCVDDKCVECASNEGCEDLYGEGWECTDGTCVEAENAEPTPTATPPPTPTTVTLSGYVPVPVNWPEVYVLGWPDGVTVGDLADICGLDPEEALEVTLERLEEAGSAQIDPETGEFSLLVSPGSYSFWFGDVTCPDGLYAGWFGSSRITVSETDTSVSVGQLTDQIHCPCD